MVNKSIEVSPQKIPTYFTAFYALLAVHVVHCNTEVDQKAPLECFK